MSHDKYYHLPAPKGGLASEGHLLECPKCKRKIHVAMALIGVPHHLGTTAMCAECLDIEDKFVQEFPEVAEKIKKWQAS